MTKVLDKGYVEWVDCMGDEARIVEAARVSVGAKKKAKRSDAELIEYLYTAGHMSPFEHVHFTFKVKAPIFVLRQWMRHRTWNYCEASMRYQEFDGEFYNPFSDDWLMDTMDDAMHNAVDAYFWGLKHDLNREVARIILPVAMYSEVLMTVDLRNLLHWLKLRLDPAAQREIREYANVIHDLVSARFPTVMEVFNQELWVEENLKLAKSELRTHFKEEQSLKPLSTSKLADLLWSRELKNSGLDVAKETTNESSDDAESVLKSILNSFAEVDRLFQEISENSPKFWALTDQLCDSTEIEENKAQNDSSEKS